MIGQKKHRSVTQNYIDLSDRLAAVRSGLAFLYVVIGIALLVSCTMYVFFDIVPVKCTLSLSGEDIRAIVQVRVYKPEKDDIVILKKSRLCAKVLEDDEKLSDGELAVSVSEINGSKRKTVIKTNEIEGKVRFIVSPLNRFGENAEKMLG